MVDLAFQAPRLPVPAAAYKNRIAARPAPFSWWPRRLPAAHRLVWFATSSATGAAGLDKPQERPTSPSPGRSAAISSPALGCPDRAVRRVYSLVSYTASDSGLLLKTGSQGYIFSGADTPSSSRPLMMTCRVASIRFS